MSDKDIYLNTGNDALYVAIAYEIGTANSAPDDKEHFHKAIALNIICDGKPNPLFLIIPQHAAGDFAGKVMQAAMEITK